MSPHRDDAAFSLGLAVGTWLESGHQVEVLNCFTESEYMPFGQMQSIRAGDRRTHVTALRHEEDLRWSRAYARPVQLIDLHLTDAPQRLQCSVDAVCGLAVNPQDAAMAKIRCALEDQEIDCLVLPLAVGDHVDHLIARIAAQSGWPSSLPVAFYEDLPYSARPGAVGGIEQRAEEIGFRLNPAFVCEPTDGVAATERKLRLASCYDSQVDRETTEQISGFCERYEGRERLWANRAWLDAGMGISY